MSLIGDIIDRVLFPNQEIHGIPVLDGAFSPNQRLEHGTMLGDAIERPDDIAFGPDDALYVSSGQAILRCVGTDFSDRRQFAGFDSAVGGLAWTDDGRLLACVTGKGLCALDRSGNVLRWLETADGAPLACPTAVTVAHDGTIYLTVGSQTNLPDQWLTDLMQRRPPSGRLISCNAQLGDARTCAERLSWPAGAVVSHDEREVWVCESWTHSLSAFARDGGRRRIMVKNYAGYPARIARGGTGDYWLAFFALRSQLTEFVLRERRFCDDMMAAVPPDLWIGPSLDGRFNYREPTQIGRIKKLGIQKPWAPARSYGLVARLRADGDALESMHSRVDGKVHGVTAIRLVGSRIVIASKGRDRLVALDPLAASAQG